MATNKDYNFTGLIMKDLNKYKLIGSIGKGAYGTVILAERVETRAPRAIKVLKKSEILMDSSNMAFARSEIEFLLTVKEEAMFPNLLFVKEGSDFLYLGFDFHIGGTLMQLLPAYENVPILSTHQMTFIIMELAIAILYLHRHGLVHRDIKPTNIFITADGHLVVGDFGLMVRRAEGEPINNKAGSPGYVSFHFLRVNY